MHGLDTYDYGARQYNPVLARWDRVDPLCEKYYSISPYAYCGNNPVNRVDKDGRLFDTFLDGVFFLYDVADAGYQLISSGSVSNTTMAALGADFGAFWLPFATGAGPIVRASEKAASETTRISRGLRNADAIAEGRAFERSELITTKASGQEVGSQVRLVPQNGVGNIKGNRSTVDQLIRGDNDIFKIIETKLREGASELSKGQKAVEKKCERGK